MGGGTAADERLGAVRCLGERKRWAGGVHSKQLWVPFRILLRTPASRTALSDEERVMVVSAGDVNEMPKFGPGRLEVARLYLGDTR